MVAWLSQRSRMFARGWGDEAVLQGSSRREHYLVTPPPIAVAWGPWRGEGQSVIRDGTFHSPLNSLPEAVQTAHVRCWARAKNEAACVILAASRDEGYRVRERLFGPLTERGIDLFLLENPFYGLRRNGRGPADITVAEHCLMARGTVQEARALLTCLKPRYARLAVAGYSMGGHMAAITAAVSPSPVACAALASGASASAIYTRGLLARSVDFVALGGKEARARLQTVFDAADITNFRPPIRPDVAVVSGCVRDGYVLPSETERLHRHWKGSELRWIDAGHFSALITHRRALRACVEEAVGKL